MRLGLPIDKADVRLFKGDEPTGHDIDIHSKFLDLLTLLIPICTILVDIAEMRRRHRVKIGLVLIKTCRSRLQKS